MVSHETFSSVGSDEPVRDAVQPLYEGLDVKNLSIVLVE